MAQMKKRLIEVKRDGFLLIKVVKPTAKTTIEWHPTEMEASDAAEAAVLAEPENETYVVPCKSMMRFPPETNEVD